MKRLSEAHCDDIKREFLKELGIEESVIEKIMAENGKDIEAVKAKTKADEQSLAQQKSEIESLKTQLIEANKAIDGFKELDVEGIKKAAQDWETKAKEAELKRQSDLDNLKFDYALKDKLKELKAKDAEIVAGLLNKDDLKITEKGEVLGLDEQLKTLKKDKGFLFEDDKDGKLRRRSIEAAVRQCVMQGARDMSKAYMQGVAEDIGADGWEISAHLNCAPDRVAMRSIPPASC